MPMIDNKKDNNYDNFKQNNYIEKRSMMMMIWMIDGKRTIIVTRNLPGDFFQADSNNNLLFD